MTRRPGRKAARSTLASRRPTAGRKPRTTDRPGARPNPKRTRPQVLKTWGGARPGAGRKRDKRVKTCPCGAMSLKRARQRYHHCSPRKTRKAKATR